MCCWWEPRYGWPHGVADRGLRLEPYADANELVLYKAALLTFGGAYAVLPMFIRALSGHYGWLTPRK